MLEGVEEIKDLEPGMILEGTVSNVTNFGAFVDLGVHQDGLVHISSMADHFVKDPRALVKAGDVIKVKVLQVDVQRKRIGLSMRLDERPAGKISDKGDARSRGQRKPPPKSSAKPIANESRQAQGGAMADALAKAMKSGR